MGKQSSGIWERPNTYRFELNHGEPQTRRGGCVGRVRQLRRPRHVVLHADEIAERVGVENLNRQNAAVPAAQTSGRVRGAAQKRRFRHERLFASQRRADGVAQQVVVLRVVENIERSVRPVVARVDPSRVRLERLLAELVQLSFFS